MKKVVFLLAAVVAIAVAFAAVTLVQAWALMLLVGILWGEFSWLAPIGLLPAWGLVILGLWCLGLAGRTWRSPSITMKTLHETVGSISKKTESTSIWN